LPKNIKKENRIVENYNPQGEELDVQQYLRERIPILKKTKDNILGNFNFKQLMKDADREYIPHNLREGKSSSVMLIQDEIKGLRGSRVVPIGDMRDNWRSDVSEPILMAKIQTALSILIDQNPEAIFKALNEKYKKNTALAYSLWKRSWDIGRSKHQLKTVIFDIAKYGWGIGRTYPRFIQRKGKILIEVNDDHPEKNKYDDVNITQYNDIFRERLDPYKTWIDDMTNLVDPWSMGDWYYEKDYSWDSFLIEFGDYKNIKYVNKSNKEPIEGEETERQDIVTVGFYESVDKDLYAIKIPAQDVILYYAPLPNDKKKLSCWWSIWHIRDPKTPYGIGLYEIIRNDKVLYDRIRNMNVDQMVMSIYPMLFYTGAGGLTGQGDFVISPALIKQKAAGTSVEQVIIKYDNRGNEAIEKIKQDMDEMTGITPTLQGEIEGKTLGETLHAKDSALKRLSIPLKNIAYMLEEEAFISLAWMKQCYSIPEVKSFADENELQSYVEETGRFAHNITPTQMDETGQPQQIQGDFYPNFEMALEDREGTLIESKDNQFFTVGENLPLESLDWEGMITIDPKSVLSPTPELERQRKLELYNLITPTIEKISFAIKQDVDLAIALTKPVIQILEIQNEKPKLWLPDEVIKAMENPEQYKQEMMMQQQQMMQQEQQSILQKGPPLFVGGKGANKVVPQNEITNSARKTVAEIAKPRV